jgi:hypothetical protein
LGEDQVTPSEIIANRISACRTSWWNHRSITDSIDHRPHDQFCQDCGPLIALLTEQKQNAARITAIGQQLEADRSTVAEQVTKIKRAIGSRLWLTEGRGSYEWDDDRYREEFATAIHDIMAELGPLARIAADWNGCPRTAAEVADARIDWQARAEKAESEAKKGAQS